jgi:hypothetical protein
MEEIMAFSDNTVNLGNVVRPPAGKFPLQRISRSYDEILPVFPVSNYVGKEFNYSSSVKAPGMLVGLRRGIHKRIGFKPRYTKVELSGLGVVRRKPVRRAPLTKEQLAAQLELQRMKQEAVWAAQQRAYEFKMRKAKEAEELRAQKAAVLESERQRALAFKQQQAIEMSKLKAEQWIAKKRLLPDIKTDRIKMKYDFGLNKLQMKTDLALQKNKGLVEIALDKQRTVREVAFAKEDTARAREEYKFKTVYEPLREQYQGQIQVAQMQADIMARQSPPLPEPVMNTQSFYSGQESQSEYYDDRPQVTARQTPYDSGEIIERRSRPQFPQEYYQEFGPGAEVQPEADYTPELNEQEMSGFW